ncbi:MAG: FAD-binding oxidoreductase [Sphingomonadaceae bacterium]|nr:FAD-binding oxidoreductase [Sphingomonadaceae bacterium]
MVDRLRAETVALFRHYGAASNQIGRTYPFREALSEPVEMLLTQIKHAVDPQGLMNPGVLGFAQNNQ